MSSPNVVAAIGLAVDLIGIAARFGAAAQQVSALVAAAQAEGRDITAEEWATLQGSDTVARARLVAALDRIEREG